MCPQHRWHSQMSTGTATAAGPMEVQIVGKMMGVLAGSIVVEAAPLHLVGGVPADSWLQQPIMTIPEIRISTRASSVLAFAALTALVVTLCTST